MSENRVFLLGAPSPIGGANVEAGHTALLWRRMGIDVTVVPLASCSCRSSMAAFDAQEHPWHDRLVAAGCRIVPSGSRFLTEVPGLRGAMVSGWCNQHVLHLWPELHRLGCRLVWSPTMTYLSPVERSVFHDLPPTAVHFQSEYQRAELAAAYAWLGCPREHHYLIRGAFELTDFPCRLLARNGRAFVVGRLARPARSKWSRDLWQVLGSVRKRRITLWALCMGWSAETEGKCGPAPSWAECLPPGAMPAQQFLQQCHALLCMNGGDQENWPRIGLEAMAAGVPIVADRAGGWVEMIEHGTTGLLCDTPAEFASALTRLATDEPYRMAIVENARRAVRRLTDPESLGARWTALFNELEER